MGIVNLIFPRNCLGCGKGGCYICESCVRKTRTSPKICIECEKLSVDGITHAKCRRRQGLDGAVSIWTYEGVIRKAILNLKYKFVLEIVKGLASYALDELRKKEFIFDKNPILVPIPLHRLRGNWRGFNQAEEIGSLIARGMGWKFIPDLLVRKKKVRPQTELKRDERVENVRNIFSFNPNYKLLITNYQSLILFDDVLTTGSTLKEAAKVLKTCLRSQGRGAKTVWGLTIAR